MSRWRIKILYLGKILVPKDVITQGFDPGTKVWYPYLGVLLRDGENNVLVDAGISAKYIVDGKAWGGYPAEGGESFVEEALREEGLSPEDIHVVVYTHLHNDHVGACHLFKRARHIFQRDEWKELVDPLPLIKFRGDFDPAAIAIFGSLDCHRIEGDLGLLPGLTIYKNPGHTAGGQILSVETEGGTYVISGDTLISNPNAFPQLTEITGIDGKTTPITPAPEGYGPAIPSALTNNWYDWYDSVFQIKSLLKGPEFLIAGHEPSVVGKSFP